VATAPPAAWAPPLTSAAPAALEPEAVPPFAVLRPPLGAAFPVLAPEAGAAPPWRPAALEPPVPESPLWFFEVWPQAFSNPLAAIAQKAMRFTVTSSLDIHASQPFKASLALPATERCHYCFVPPSEGDSFLLELEKNDASPSPPKKPRKKREIAGSTNAANGQHPRGCDAQGRPRICAVGWCGAQRSRCALMMRSLSLSFATKYIQHMSADRLASISCVFARLTPLTGTA
jgi:hypothetical protein